MEDALCTLNAQIRIPQCPESTFNQSSVFSMEHHTARLAVDQINSAQRKHEQNKKKIKDFVRKNL